MSSILSQNNNYSAAAGPSDVNTPQRLQNELNLLLNEMNESQTGGKSKRKQKGGNALNSEERLKEEFDILMEEIKANGSALPTDLLEGGKRKKASSKKSKKLFDQEGGKRKKASSKKSKKLFDQEGGKRKKSSKKSSRKQSRELSAALVAFQKLVKTIVEGLNITGVRKFAFKLAAEYKKMANGDVDEAIKLFNKEKSSGKAKERYNAIAK